MRKILSDADHKRLTKLKKQVDAYTDDKYRRIEKILDPLLKNLDDYTVEELQYLVDTMPGISFYRAEIRTYLNKKLAGER